MHALDSAQPADGRRPLARKRGCRGGGGRGSCPRDGRAHLRRVGALGGAEGGLWRPDKGEDDGSERRTEARMLGTIRALPARFLVREGRGGRGEGDGSVALSRKAPVAANRRRRRRHRGGQHGEARVGSIREKGRGRRGGAGEDQGVVEASLSAGATATCEGSTATAAWAGRHGYRKKKKEDSRKNPWHQFTLLQKGPVALLGI